MGVVSFTIKPLGGTRSSERSGGRRRHRERSRLQAHSLPGADLINSSSPTAAWNIAGVGFLKDFFFFFFLRANFLLDAAGSDKSDEDVSVARQ